MEGGELFEGRFRLIREVGRGNFAVVVHGRHEDMDRDVALKFLRPDLMRSHPDVGERFVREGRLASRLSNRHTVAVFDLGKTVEGVPFMVLEYLQGRSLDELIDSWGALGMRRSIRLTLQILESLHEAHGQRIIHRDLKPANIMVGRRQEGDKKRLEAKVLDFGVAKLVEAPGQTLDEGGGRKSTQFIGTPRYMSPEQILGQSVGPASDLYSLGLIFFEMCTGEDSLPNENVAKVAQYHLDEEPLKLKGIEDLPTSLARIIRKATSRYAEDRFQSAKEFGRALRKAVEDGKNRNRSANRRGAGGDAVPGAEKERHRRSTSEVFSGKGYVALPEEAREESDHGVSNPGGRPRKTPPSPVSTRAVSAPGEPQKLELDTETLQEQRRQIAERRRASHRRQREREQGLDWSELARTVGAVAALITGGYLGFCIVAGSLSALGDAARWGLGALPLGLAWLWVSFSQTSGRGWRRRVLYPWAARSWLMAGISLGFLGVAMPEHASASLASDSTWWMGAAADTWALQWLAEVTERVCGMASVLLDWLAMAIPWS